MTSPCADPQCFWVEILCRPHVHAVEWEYGRLTSSAVPVVGAQDCRQIELGEG